MIKKDTVADSSAHQNPGLKEKFIILNHVSHVCPELCSPVSHWHCKFEFLSNSWTSLTSEFLTLHLNVLWHYNNCQPHNHRADCFRLFKSKTPVHQSLIIITNDARVKKRGEKAKSFAAPAGRVKTQTWHFLWTKYVNIHFWSKVKYILYLSNSGYWLDGNYINFKWKKSIADTQIFWLLGPTVAQSHDFTLSQVSWASYCICSHKRS